MSQHQSVSLHVDMQAIRDYAEITGDYNPIHLDPEFAAKTPMGGVIAHGTLSMNLIWRHIELNHGRSTLQGAQLDIKFVAPVRVGDTLTVNVSGDVKAEQQVSVVNQSGLAVIDGVLRLQAD